MYVSPDLPVVVRDASTIQYGTSPAHGLVLGDLTEAEVTLLTRMPTMTTRTHLRRLAARLGISAARLDALIDVLCEAGVAARSARSRCGTSDDAWWRRRAPGIEWDETVQRMRVAIHGCSPIGVALARCLAAMRVGTIYLDDPTPVTLDVLGDLDPSLLGTPRDRAFARALTTADTRVSARTAPEADVEVAVSAFDYEPAWAHRQMRTDRTHLPIVYSEGGVEVGPLVRPGRTPCLHCVTLERRDADRAWPLVSAQLRVLPPPRVETLLTIQVAAFAAREIAAVATGRPCHLDAMTWLWTSEDPVALTHTWSRHPECTCHLT